MSIEKISFKKFLPGIAWFFVVAVLVFMPGDDVPKIGWMGGVPKDKIVHLTMFAILTFLFCLPYLNSNLSLHQKYRRFLFISILLIVWGIAIEFIQKYFAYHRSFDLYDWLADIIGIVIAILVLRNMAKKKVQNLKN